MKSKRNQHEEENIVGRKRRAVERNVLPDGHYWYRNFINLRGGGHVDEWKLAQIVGGKFRRIGVKAEWEQDCEYLRNALWARIEPPSEAGDTAAVRTGGKIRRDDRVGRAGRGWLSKTAAPRGRRRRSRGRSCRSTGSAG